jgi:hypothetical protein
LYTPPVVLYPLRVFPVAFAVLSTPCRGHWLLLLLRGGGVACCDGGVGELLCHVGCHRHVVVNVCGLFMVVVVTL